MLRIGILAGLVMLAGCGKAPANKAQPVMIDSTSKIDPSWTLANPCPPGVSSVYQTPDGSYMVWNEDNWVKLSNTLTPDQFCSQASGPTNNSQP